MRNLREGLIGLTVAGATLGGATIPSHATGFFGLISWTSGRVVTVSTTTYPNPKPPPATITITTRTVTVIIDPPPTFRDFDITVGYNPSMFQFLGGGTLCQFGVGGDCPAVDTTSGTIPIPSVSSLTLGAALPDSSLTLTDSGSSVQLSYDLSGVTSPPVAGADVNFFGLVFSPRVSLADTVTVQSTPGAYDITFSSVACTLSDMTSCKTNNPTYGFSFTAIPESSTWVMMIVGFAGLGFAGYHKANSSRIALASA